MSVTDEMVERGAERLWRIDYGYLEPWTDVPERLRDAARKTARAVLEAAHDPEQANGRRE